MLVTVACPQEVHAACLPRLTKHQARQLDSWCAAAAADYAADAAAVSDNSDSSSGEGGGCCSRGFVLPSAAHARMLAGRRLLQGRDWPVEYCTLRGGGAALQALQGVVQRVPSFQVPPYSKLYQVRAQLCAAAEGCSLRVGWLQLSRTAP